MTEQFIETTILKFKEQGLIFKDDELRDLFQLVSIYRFKQYSFYFLTKDSKKSLSSSNSPQKKIEFIEGTKLNDILSLYEFDKALRKLLFNYTEDIEISILRNQIAQYLIKKYGDFGYLDESNYYVQNEERLNQVRGLIQTIAEENSRNITNKTIQYESKEQKQPPLHIAVEGFSFNTIIQIFWNLKKEDKKYIIKRYDIDKPEIFWSWLKEIKSIRNKCAHYNRLWNRTYLEPVKLLRTRGHLLHEDLYVPNDTYTLYGRILIIQYLLKFTFSNLNFFNDLNLLLEKYPSINILEMGFPKDWKENQIWGGK